METYFGRCQIARGSFNQELVIINFIFLEKRLDALAWSRHLQSDINGNLLRSIQNSLIGFNHVEFRLGGFDFKGDTLRVGDVVDSQEGLDLLVLLHEEPQFTARVKGHEVHSEVKREELL